MKTTTRVLMLMGAALPALTAASANAQDVAPSAPASSPAPQAGPAAPPAPGVAAEQPAALSPPADLPAAQNGEIVVTAQKRSERLQDVPIAVSVVSGQALAALSRPGLEGAVTLVPALNFQKSGTTLNQSLFLRGVGTTTFSIAGEPSVSTVVDGVVFARSGEAFGDLVDIDRLEVLRGPQGTLFGKNASAGVVNIVSVQPTRELGGYVEGGYFTNGNEPRVRGALNIPVSEDLLTRFTGFYGRYDGNIRNVATGGGRVNGYEHYGARAQVKWTPSSATTIALIGDYHRNDDNCCAEVIGTGALNAAGAPITSPVFAVLPTPLGDRTRTVNQNLVTRTREEGYGVSVQVDTELGTQTVTSITAYRDYRNTEIRDGDFLPRAYVGFNQLHDTGPQTGNTFSQELRLTSPARQFLAYVVGLYYSRAKSERIYSRSDIVCNGATTLVQPVPCDTAGAPASTTPFGRADFGSVFKNISAFGQATANVTDRFRFIGGLRWTADQLDVFHSRATTLAGPGIQPSFPTTPTGTGNPATAFTGKTTNTNLSGKASLQYDVTRNVTAYGGYTRGYKGPAFNVFFNLTATGTNVIAPETSDSYEVGLKNTLFGGKLVLNLDAFYAKYDNFQANNPDLVAGVVVTRFTNAGKVSTRGAEADIVLRPVDDLSFSGGIAYTDARVDQFLQAPGAAVTAVIPAGTALPFAPKWKGSLGADYRWRTGGAVDLFLGAQGNYQSKQLALFSPDAVQRRLGTIDSYGLVNLSAGVGDADDRYRLTFQVRNLFDQSFAAAIQNGGPAGSYRYQIPRDADRYYGITGRINF
ncbi:TonB-dependent receptor [Sphingomonas sp. Leaf20]|uniref:TonB-dependent receptor n=1 Tax=Sphingomonas sp. Leaf20 TaxID=1735685 RepID=UPI0006F5A5FE|nr:TonB-dependent receptor [Sphingomonas sp. Leaf20]KQM74520.1 TonB-dependent receptor [Sphingomonas sp. Leaf20]